jgi:cobalt-zinc-cadmium resistance protein CzcA
VVRVSDIADVRWGALARNGVVTRNGEGEAVWGIVLGLRGANARTVVEGAKARLAEVQKTLPEGVRIEIFYDRNDLIEKAVWTVQKVLLEALALVVVLLLLFLGNLRAALVVSLSLPLAVLATFGIMQLYGLSANIMSLGGWPSPSACWWTARWWWWRMWPTASRTRTAARTSRPGSA